MHVNTFIQNNNKSYFFCPLRNNNVCVYIYIYIEAAPPPWALQCSTIVCFMAALKWAVELF